MLTFRDYPLLLQDPEGQLSKWLDRWYSLDDLRIFAAEVVARTINLNVPLPNWPAPPRMKLNTFYCPTGATRWGFGLFLIDEITREKLVAENDTSGTLEFDNVVGDANSEHLKLQYVHMLPPRLLTLDGETCPGVWVLPLVDERYFWQFQDIGARSDLDATSWNALIDSLSLQIPTSTTLTCDAVPTGYGTPDLSRMPRDYENIALILDAVGASIGQRLVPKLDEFGYITFGFIAPTSSEGILQNNFKLHDYQVIADIHDLNADGVFLRNLQGKPDIRWNHLPQYFRLIVNGTDAHTVAIADVFTEDYETHTIRSFTATVHDSELREILTGADGNSLARQYATDWWKWRLVQFDISAPGNIAWNFTGYEDAIWWHFAAQQPSQAEEYAAFTRVWSLPENFSIAEPVNGGTGGLIPIQLTEALQACGRAHARRLDLTQEPPAMVGAEFQVMDFMHLTAEAYWMGWADPVPVEVDEDASASDSSIDTCYPLVSIGPPCEGSSSSGSENSEVSGSEESGASGSGASGEGSGASGEESTSKDTAIVPASWTPTGYAALFVAEMPEVRFDDVIIANIKSGKTSVLIDPKFLEVCEPHTVEVCGLAPEAPVAIGARVVGGSVIVEAGGFIDPVRVVIRLTGIRKGFRNHRFPSRTREQFLSNEKFINSAYKR